MFAQINHSTRVWPATGSRALFDGRAVVISKAGARVQLSGRDRFQALAMELQGRLGFVSLPMHSDSTQIGVGDFQTP